MIDYIVDGSERRGRIDIRVGVGGRRRWCAEEGPDRRGILRARSGGIGGDRAAYGHPFALTRKVTHVYRHPELIQASGRARAWSGSRRRVHHSRHLLDQQPAPARPSDATPAALALLAFLVAVLVTAALTR